MRRESLKKIADERQIRESGQQGGGDPVAKGGFIPFKTPRNFYSQRFTQHLNVFMARGLDAAREV